MTNFTSDQVLNFLNPRSIALIGATDSSTFSALGFANLALAPSHISVHLVNPRSPVVHGQSTVARCVDIDGGIDLAMIMVRTDLIFEALHDAASAGATGAVILGSGFAEAGTAGKELQDQLIALANELGVILLGPNSLGFVNLHAGIAAMTMGDPLHAPGAVALISQSGASCGAMKDFASLSAIGLSHIITVGNEASLTIGHLINALVDDPQTRAIAIFMEAIREPAVFRAAAQRAMEKNKPIVILKAGRSEIAAAVAQSHTGALVGDDTVVGAVFDQFGIMRVNSIEELLTTASVAAHTGKWKSPTIGMVAMSGGACDMVADLADAYGLHFGDISAATSKKIATLLPEYGTARNPLDITGAAIKDPELWTNSITAMGSDPEIGALLAVHNLPLGDSTEVFYGQKFINAIGAGINAVDIPAIYVTQVTQPLGPLARRALSEAGVNVVVPGMQLAVRACAQIAQWSTTPAPLVPKFSAVPPMPPLDQLPQTFEPMSESQVRELFVKAGINVVPALHVHSVGEAQDVAREMKCPIAMKIVSPDIVHKTDIGGVRLGVTASEVESAYDQIVSAGQLHGRVDGVLISPMRQGGIEVLVGVRRDPDWGLVLALGPGGILVELLADVTVTCLPVDTERIKRAISQTRLKTLLQGIRGGPPADLDALTKMIERICALAEALGPELESLEINPLRIEGSLIEAMDGVVSWTTNSQ